MRKELTADDRDQILSLIDYGIADLNAFKERIKKITISDPLGIPSKISLGLKPDEVIATVKEFLSDWVAWRKTTGWNMICINIETGQVAYTKNGEPSDDGYIKGYTLLIDIHTNRMIARHYKNIGIPLVKLGFKSIEMLDWFLIHYKMPAPDSSTIRNYEGSL